MTSHIDLDAITLHEGGHDDPEDGHCLLEVVSMFAHEEFSDLPACVSPVLAAFGRSWNDGMRSDAERDQLRQYVPLLPGTAGHPDIDEQASRMAFDWLVRVHTPTWLRLAGLTAEAERLEALPELRASTDVQTILQLLREVREDAARNARNAAGDAAAGDAVAAAVAAAAGYAAVAAAAGYAGYAAVAAAEDAAEDAARAAAEDALQPTVDQLQTSAHHLYQRMIALYPRTTTVAAESTS